MCHCRVNMLGRIMEVMSPRLAAMAISAANSRAIFELTIIRPRHMAMSSRMILASVSVSPRPTDAVFTVERHSELVVFARLFGLLDEDFTDLILQSGPSGYLVFVV